MKNPIVEELDMRISENGARRPSWAQRAADEIERLEKVQTELVAALELAKDMFISNDLILPHTFEVIDEAIEKAKAGAA